MAYRRAERPTLPPSAAVADRAAADELHLLVVAALRAEEQLHHRPVGPRDKLLDFVNGFFLYVYS